MIPCIKNKCISYPICISKKTITCKEIEEYHKYLKKKYGYGLRECFDEINLTLKSINQYSTNDVPMIVKGGIFHLNE